MWLKCHFWFQLVSTDFREPRSPWATQLISRNPPELNTTKEKVLSKFIELPFWGIEKLDQAEMEETFPRAYLTEKRVFKNGVSVPGNSFQCTFQHDFDKSL